MSHPRRRAPVLYCVLGIGLMVAERAGLARVALQPGPPESYSVQDLGPLGDHPGAGVFALNEAGTAAGAVSLGIPGGDSIPRVHACLWSPSGVLRDLGTLGGLNSVAWGLNDAGQVVGASETGEVSGGGIPVTHGFIWTEASGMQDLGLAGNAVAARAINNAGMVAGSVGENSFRWTATGGPVELPALLGSFKSSPIAVNDEGVVVGTSRQVGPGPSGGSALLPHLTRWDAEGIATEVMGLGRFNSAADINTHGEIAGNSFQVNYNRVLRRYSVSFSGSFVQSVRKARVVLGRNFSVARINAKGEAVGQLLDARAPGLWRRGKLINLEHRIPPHDGWTLESAVDLNDAGRVLVRGRRADGDEHALLLVPDAKPNCAQDVTEQVTITRSPTDARTADQTLIIRNSGGAPIQYPDLALEGLTAGLRWKDGLLRTECVKPVGTPYAPLLAAEDSTLAPGETVTFSLHFTGKTGGPLRYRARVLAGDGVR